MIQFETLLNLPLPAFERLILFSSRLKRQHDLVGLLEITDSGCGIELGKGPVVGSLSRRALGEAVPGVGENLAQLSPAIPAALQVNDCGHAAADELLGQQLSVRRDRRIGGARAPGKDEADEPAD